MTDEINETPAEAEATDVVGTAAVGDRTFDLVEHPAEAEEATEAESDSPE